MAEKIHLNSLGYSLGKKSRLYDLLYNHGCKNGTLMILPIDQGLEHGPIDFLDNPEAEHPSFQFELAIKGGFNAIACHIGLAKKYYNDFAGRIPLVLKINGRTNIPSNENAFSSQDATVEDAVAIGAIAVGYTLFVGSTRQDEDISQLAKIREDCDKYGMPLIVWSYPRGSAIDKKGGQETLYAVDYAAREALELGADIIKINYPLEVNDLCPKKYKELAFDYSDDQRVDKVIRSAGRAFVIFSGGSKISEDEILRRIEIIMQQGGAGVIFGRNLWQRPFDEGLRLAEKIRSILLNYPR